MMAANPSSAKKGPVVCRMRPLQDCLAKNDGDIRQCIEEVKLFETTCSKKIEYVHDREGLDDNRSGLFSGKKGA
ncbi:hypothetical protein TGPRC2_212760 [Toxoplasma gondii TgCatPRC2]|uniref:Uncharacterized protein n=14 Tax=Toxoplasma gondii TaxID=5811 RepID=A0A125YGB6_TOXGV|nr:hypothetical protein TGME49_212760 [Toxoplasma gondii ME49]EPR59592.1 hypothetical protein TGGT1_212760 [Toxoplasma gondii GT1]ESS30716.1 hypothetical protein TGVEG_212760 [Toxoplasma gondii VEG]KFG40425.1 hypothetical protein TGDOM2_212760 [Toxoplasma gondii GAB2-2007-GAL-DOM2]KFG44133.1 hypothetical protein TGP89_212760 [Toxoplasma gondii p89]KFG54992.1 hypothetical protein TGFOU_212760 [Toxoplasma gondii FOU]KFG63065.1 hypothetical protein TGRUB_212760 [Toxoplasma gondii RUB]KFH08685.1|eukprot:XP_008883960.1 hypothetical protein HHA_212760 [Hammondia hammondi]